jgi:uncharacterized protein (TIGR02647 family)
MITDSMQSEMNLLLQFPTESRMNGLKVHHEASPDTIDAAKRLFDKGFIDQPDGGYLTDAGIEMVEHLQRIHNALKN